MARTERALTGLSQARRTEDRARKEELEQVRAGLLEMKKEWENWQR